MISVVPGELWHWRWLLCNVRSEQRCDDAPGARQVAEADVLASRSWTGLTDGVPFVMWGLKPDSLLGGSAVVWMVGSPEVAARRVGFLRRCRAGLEECLRAYSLLRCWALADFESSIRWLRWLGFEEVGRQDRLLYLEKRA